MKERIKQLCREKGITIRKVETDLGLSNGYISKLDASDPSATKIQAIAAYLDTTIDYLINGIAPDHYYLNEKTAEIAQAVYDDPDLRLLFDAARKAKPENVRLAAEMLRRFKNE